MNPMPGGVREGGREAPPYSIKEAIEIKIYHADLTTEALDAYRRLHPSKNVQALLSYGRRDANFSKRLSSHRSKIDGLILDSGTFTLNSNPTRMLHEISKKYFFSAAAGTK